jgi:hypothetical protein
MLANTLNTNEIKNAAGTEVEFGHQLNEGRTRVFQQLLELPAFPHRLRIAHIESGSGLRLVRRSLVRFDKTVISTVDNITPVVCSALTQVVYPIGALIAKTEMTNVLAECMSFCASLGASTTILYDCSGNGADALINGTL